MFVKWDITDKCNLNCIHCEVGGGKDSKDELNFDKIIDAIDKLKKNDLYYIHFLGGEPFLKDKFIKILEHCNNNGIGIGITTNGTHFNDPRVEDFIKQIKVPFHIYFSVDGPNSFTQDKIRGMKVFDRCLNALSIIRNNKRNNPYIKLGISATINNINKDSISEYIDLSNEYDIDILVFSMLRNEGNAKKNCNQLKVSNSDIIKAVNSLLKSLSKSQRELDIRLQIPPKAIQYFNSKYNCNMPIESSADICMLVNKTGIRINSKGEIFPCDSTKINKQLIDLGLLKNSNISSSDCRFLSFEEENSKLKTHINESLLKYKSLMEDNSCEYKDSCICPMNIDVNKDRCILCNQLIGS